MGLADVRENSVVDSTTAEQSEDESRERLWGWILRAFGNFRRSGGVVEAPWSYDASSVLNPFKCWGWGEVETGTIVAANLAT